MLDPAGNVVPVPNRTKEILQAGGLAASFNVSRMRTADAAGIGHACGFQWLFIDLEHNMIDPGTAADMCVAALVTGITPIARVPGHEHHHASRMLDAGAQGIVVPHIDTAEQARAVVRSCLYPPLGDRSLTGALPQLRFQALPIAQAIELLNENTLVVVMLETAQAIANADAIAAVEGVDVLLVGSNDLAANLGIPGEFGHARMRAAYASTIDACRRHGKFAGMGGIYEEALMAEYIVAGVRFMLGGADVAFMMAGGKQRAAFLNKLQPAGVKA
ncbi:MAG: aldolase/citrate lyase family protein [Polaromonas sp.]|uniref:HpcH/HpaI aldolase family protein n=1 Tax=Polaromonas sp. TaxID=1869339 RepID=UPI002730128D|nr:aldolase/citrate lyase family protein [Polaromonas sp.]MDP2254718.1 aldolase/citrate lyase family protein [Polaromonas sp.]